MAGDQMTYKGFTASSEVSAEDECLVGRVLFINDVIVFEGKNVKELRKNFHASIDDYLDHCARSGKPANKPFSGTFNVRIGSELHRQAALAAAKSSINLNEFVTNSIAAAVSKHESSRR